MFPRFRDNKTMKLTFNRASFFLCTALLLFYVLEKYRFSRHHQISLYIFSEILEEEINSNNISAQRIQEKSLRMLRKVK